jgi:hypothetical protein
MVMKNEREAKLWKQTRKTRQNSDLQKKIKKSTLAFHNCMARAETNLEWCCTQSWILRRVALLSDQQLQGQ